MRFEPRKSIPLSLLRTSVAMMLTIAPYQFTVGSFGPEIKAASALAKNGDRGDRGDHGGRDDHGGRGEHSGRSGGGHGDSDHSGRGRGGDDRAGDDHGGDRARDDRSHDDRDDGGRRHGRHHRNHKEKDDDRKGREHVDPATGIKVEVKGNQIEVSFPDGSKEEIESGRYERKNAQGRTVEERPATQADTERLIGFLR